MDRSLIEGFRLAPQQRRLWPLQQGDSCLPYFSQCAVSIEGALEPRILEEALHDVISRHEILRTSFHCFPGDSFPLQVIADDARAAVKYYDFSRGAPPEQIAGIEKLFQEARRLLSQSERRLQLDVALVTLSRWRHWLLLSLPALCADARTLQNLVCEIRRSYAARSRGERLSDESVQYADLSEIFNQLLESEETQAGSEYWRRQNIAGLLSPKLSYEMRASLTSHFDPRSLDLKITSEVVSGATALAQKHGLPTSVFFLSCWQTLIWRLTSEATFMIGIAYDGRTYEGLDRALGLIERHLPFHCRLSGNHGFIDLMKEAGETAGELARWQDYFSWETIEKSQATETEAGYRSFQFEWRKSAPPRSAAGLKWSIDRQDACIDRFKVKFSLLQRRRDVIAKIHYDHNLFREEDIRRLAEELETIIESALRNPESTIDELNILSERERETLLLEFNRTRLEYPEVKCVHEIFEELATEIPDHAAVMYEDTKLTYGELNRKANQLAHYLQKMGVGPEVKVGIHLERSVEIMVGILGVLKAGGAYVPIDPACPRERLAFMMEDTGAAALLTERGLLVEGPLESARIVRLDEEWKLIAQESDRNPAGGAMPENLAYVIYTSGSTGKPKGVAIEHRQLFNYVNGLLRRLEIPAHATFATVSTFAADLGNTVVFSSLFTGGCLHIISEQRASDPKALAEYFRQHPIDYLKIVPSHLAALIASGYAEQIPPRRRLILGGEASSWELIENLNRLAPHCSIHNHYGPTETTIGALTYKVGRDRTKRGSVAVSLGRPLPNVQIYLLNAKLNPSPIGAVGEIYIGGAGVGRGYLNNPDLTAERFIPNPFSILAGERLYKTGDLARYLPEGDLEFLGRLDHQVKIRGFRIELGEIEAVIAQHPGVRQCLAIAREDRPGDKRLVAYVTSGEEEEALVAKLKQELDRRLPDYMAPTHYVVLEKLPLTPNGKVDRQALPAPAEKRLRLTENDVGPRAPIEEIIAGIWSQVLGIRQIGVNDNFFELGGHSLLLTQVVSRLREALRLDVPMRSVFDAPTVASLAASVNEMLREERNWRMPPILPISRGASSPLSFAQQRLWFLDQLNPGNPAYNMPAAVRLSGALNAPALEQSLGEVIRRHEVLRAIFDTVEGEAVQIVTPARPVELAPLDLSAWPEAEREMEVRRLAEEEAQRPFDLARGPLMRAMLLRLGAQEHVALFTTHHIISDGWSMRILIREIAALYEAFSTGKPSPLPELTIQYADFAIWQREWLQGVISAEQLAYWKDQMRDAAPSLDLPTDRPRPAVLSFRGAREFFMLPPDLSEEVKRLSQREGMTLFMILLAAFKTLLYRYTGQEDIVVGAPIAGRNHLETEELIGFFVNTLVLRTVLSGKVGFLELARKVREVVLGAYEHQDLPFEKIVEELQPERNLSRQPLFQVAFALGNLPKQSLELPALRLQSIEADHAPERLLPGGIVSGPEGDTAKFDLTLTVSETADGLIGHFEYNTDLFDAVTIERMMRYWQTLLQSIVADPQQQLSRLSLLPPSERGQLLAALSETRTDYPARACIHELFESQTEQTPQAVAVVYADGFLSYADLNARANQVARRLMRLGVGPEARVGICMERSAEMVVGLLGILKAGGVCLPLDLEYPRERLAFMLADSQVKVLLTQRSLIGTFPQYGGQPVCLDADWETISRETSENLASGAVAENAAYVFYTSGSTGIPKGINVPHQAICRLVMETNYINLAPGDSVAQLSNASFDAAIFEIWGALLHGARLVGIPKDVLLSPKDFAALIREQAISSMFLTTALFNQLAKEVPWAFKPVRDLLIGGEAMDAKWIREVIKRGAPERIINVYGPTECATFSSWYLIREVPEEAVSLPIGVPISNTQLYVLDEHLQPAPVGVAGHLYIGGPGLARNYHNQPGLTAEKFIPHPFSEEPGMRLYWTGDLARLLPDNNLEFIGRGDHLIKIRGFRIEPGEIETALSRHPAVSEALALVREDIPGAKQLVAYVVAAPEQTLRTSELRSFLGEKLPEYMVPGAFVVLERLPLTPNGKVDRRALPAPDQSGSRNEDFIGPRDTLELRLARIWEEVLRAPRVGVKHNFFELGGNSILSVTLVSRIEQAFGVKLPLAALYQGSTIERLAVMLRRQADPILQSPLVEIRSEGSRRPFFCVHPAGGNVICYADLARRLGPDQPFYGLQSHGSSGAGAPPPTRITEMAARYIEEICPVQAEGPYHLSGWSMGGLIAFEIARQLEQRGQEVSLLALFDTGAPLPDSAPQEVEIDDAELLKVALGEMLGEAFELTIDELRRLAPDERLAYVIELARRGDKTALDFELPQARRLFDIFKNNVRAARNYRPLSYGGRVTLFVPGEDAEDRATGPGGLTRGWDALASGGVEVHLVPGSHQTMIFDPHASTLVELLGACLAEA